MTKRKVKTKTISPFARPTVSSGRRDAHLTADEHLGDYSKSSYADRLNWLEEAGRFALTALKLKRNKIGMKAKYKPGSVISKL